MPLYSRKRLLPDSQGNCRRLRHRLDLDGSVSYKQAPRKGTRNRIGREIALTSHDKRRQNTDSRQRRRGKADIRRRKRERLSSLARLLLLCPRGARKQHDKRGNKRRRLCGGPPSEQRRRRGHYCGADRRRSDDKAFFPGEGRLSPPARKR